VLMRRTAAKSDQVGPNNVQMQRQARLAGTMAIILGTLNLQLLS
jgi:hypothetical protein